MHCSHTGDRKCGAATLARALALCEVILGEENAADGGGREGLRHVTHELPSDVHEHVGAEVHVGGAEVGCDPFR